MNTHLLGLYALAILVGTLSGIHVPINGALGARIQSPLAATVVFYTIALTTAGAVYLAVGNREAFAALKSVPTWYFAAGVISAFIIASSTYLIPRMGAVNLFVIVLSLQMIARMVISHFGWLESPISPISIFKLTGAVLLIAGALLVVRN